MLIYTHRFSIKVRSAKNRKPKKNIKVSFTHRFYKIHKRENLHVFRVFLFFYARSRFRALVGFVENPSTKINVFLFDVFRVPCLHGTFIENMWVKLNFVVRVFLFSRFCRESPSETTKSDPFLVDPGPPNGTIQLGTERFLGMFFSRRFSYLVWGCFWGVFGVDFGAILSSFG